MAVRAKPADGPKQDDQAIRLLPISDTVNGSHARERPADVLAHYEQLSGRLWLPPQLDAFGKAIFDGIGGGRTKWASLTGPYGFGKTAAGILLWQQAREADFLAIPPLSCTNYDEFAAGVAALAAAQLPKEKNRIEKLYGEIWAGGIERIAKAEAERHDIPVRKLRKILEAQLEHGRWAPDGHSHRLVEFLARLGQLSGRSSRGLVVIVDELQQLLGPLDVSSLSRLRELVWGMRTEQSPCAVILTLDTQLEARLAHWAADLLHRVREDSPALQMTAVFNRDFPVWLWERLSTPNGRSGKTLPASAVSSEVLESLGQFVERPDLANGPRTVVDVFNRAVDHFRETGKSYGVLDLVDDIHQGRFKFFGEGSPVQRILTQLLSDPWIDADTVRRSLVRTLAAYPRGCPDAVVHAHVGNGRKLKAARDQLFGPLLVELPGGLALEQLQQVSRGGSFWENALARCWDSMPGVSALAEMVPELVTRVLLPRLFTGLGRPAGEWAVLESDARAAVSGFQILRGSFDPAFPGREVAVWVGQREPAQWPEDVDLCIGFVCGPETDPSTQPSAEVANLEGTPRIVFKMPALVPMDSAVPEEIARYQKYIQPEPLRPAYVLLGLRELQGLDEAPPSGSASSNGRARKHLHAADTISTAERRKLAGFQELCLDHLMRFLLQGEIDAGVGRPVRQRGPELLRALFSVACRKRFPSYQTLITVRHWKALMDVYRTALASERLSLAQRRGQEDVTMPKADAYRLFFNQLSTAAGDSFVRSLGHLVKAAAKGDAWSFRFPLHPGESSLLEYLRGCARSRPVPLSAAREYLRHKGYVEEEATQIVSLLEARGLLTMDRGRSVRLVAGHAGMEEEARKRVFAARDQLARLLVAPRLPEPLPTRASELARLADELECQLQDKIEACRTIRKGQLDDVRAAIGSVRAIALPAEWLNTGLSTHLAGIGDTLGRTQTKLVDSLRKEAESIQAELAASDDDRFGWAVRWVRRCDSVNAQLEKLRSRVAEFEVQSAALSSWVPVNQELFAVTTLCSKISTTDPAPVHELAELLARTRERFSRESWEPLGAAPEFRGELRSISQALQGLMYSQARAYFAEVEILRQRFAPLLPNTPAPTFEEEHGGRRKARSGYDAFAALYRWALSGFNDAFARAKRLKNRRQPWTDPRKKGRSWNELSGSLECLLERKASTQTIEYVLKVGEQLSELLGGFAGIGTCVFDTPEVPPDFDLLRERFLRGEVVIRIEPKQ
jgi:hypothetical protein